MNLGATIRFLRKKKDYSLRDLAQRVGVTAPFISDIERGMRFPSEDIFVKLAAELGANIEDLRQLDPRAPLEELRQLAEDDPRYSIALREFVKQRVRPEELDAFLKARAENEPKGKRSG